MRELDAGSEIENVEEEDARKLVVLVQMVKVVVIRFGQCGNKRSCGVLIARAFEGRPELV